MQFHAPCHAQRREIASALVRNVRAPDAFRPSAGREPDYCTVNEPVIFVAWPNGYVTAR